MGWGRIGKIFKETIGGAVSGVAKQVGRTVKQTGVGNVTTGLGKVARSGYSAVAPFTMAGMFLQPEQMGIKSASNQKLFTGAQRIQRIGTGAAAAVGGAILGGPAIAGALPAGFAGGAGDLLGGAALQTLMGGFGGGGFGGGGGGGGAGGRGPLSDEAKRLMGLQEGLIGRQLETAGLSPEAKEAMRRQTQQSLRAGQAERGIFESGVAARQEGEMMPMLEQQMRGYETQQLGNIAGQYGDLAGLAAGAGEEEGSPWAGLGGQFVGNIGSNLLRMYFGGE